MAGLGWQELVIVLVIIMIIFGAGKLPEVASSLGKGVKEFKKEASDTESIASGTTASASTTSTERRDEGKVVETRQMRAEEI